MNKPNRGKFLKAEAEDWTRRYAAQPIPIPTDSDQIPAHVARALATGVAQQDAEVVEPEVSNLELPVPAALALAGAVPDRVAPDVEDAFKVDEDVGETSAKKKKPQSKGDDDSFSDIDLDLESPVKKKRKKATLIYSE